MSDRPLPPHIPLNRPRLIAPGPVEVEPRVLLELAQPQLHHRTPLGVERLMEARAKLMRLLGDPYDAVITTSSGTGAFEGALISLTPEGGRVVNAQAGKFSERWGDMSERLGYETVRVAKPWGELLDPEEVADAAREAHTLLITHSETSTGALHDLAAIAQAAKAQNPDLIIIADCVTSYGVAELRPAAWGVDAIVSGSQKGTATPPGLGFVLFSPEVQERMIPAPRRGFYLDLTRELKGQKAGNTPQTPAINLISALSLALDRLLSVPLEVLWAEKRRQADALIAAGAALGAPAWAARTSPAVAVLKPPAPLTGRQVAARLAEMGQRALAGQAPFEDAVFRVSTLGYADRYDALGIAGMLEDAFASLGVPFGRGAAVQAAWAALGGAQEVQPVRAGAASLG
ncbi:aminotransferase class V-fold PLP-dependent enzyme [Deinococcus metallilatus]|uniref:Aminotransferase class V-fold PLP-dependent enzyme n=1 Tax=Deinococcus metallilatus TaxID=1211322 RepID=A0AAJ5F4E8_9DEIO|nr:aminotransferase class V-fold PLP-dependent enzyme [Deinococcus metallilatus]MBB5294364.1 aspartate aminotransferase-like enzyme [Deinococcus metallilatus]QBY09130.1 aminotransferase class V-fold PLP-dependent enzyme [Deinococcus metallilatus]RXJ10274.1 aminotransferase class V-fold PLP-dependent enzyme [Deinococcus metallilatus]TLK22566.1 aminotransferase class V-fold PLP-dependent enzyme [Deinococcus metallilatus]GMA16299.1 aminotransferase V [Deinococcus metallilatus]